MLLFIPNWAATLFLSPLILIVNWSLVSISVEPPGAGRIMMKSFEAIFRKRTFLRALWFGLALAAVDLFFGILWFTAEALSLALWSAPWLAALLNLGAITISGTFTSVVMMAFYLDE